MSRNARSSRSIEREPCNLLLTVFHSLLQSTAWVPRIVSLVIAVQPFADRVPSSAAVDCGGSTFCPNGEQCKQ